MPVPSGKGGNVCVCYCRRDTKNRYQRGVCVCLSLITSLSSVFMSCWWAETRCYFYFSSNLMWGDFLSSISSSSLSFSSFLYLSVSHSQSSWTAIIHIFQLYPCRHVREKEREMWPIGRLVSEKCPTALRFGSDARSLLPWQRADTKHFNPLNSALCARRLIERRPTQYSHKRLRPQPSQMRSGKKKKKKREKKKKKSSSTPTALKERNCSYTLAEERSHPHTYETLATHTYRHGHISL